MANGNNFFTERENQVILLMEQGLSSQEIAKTLKIGRHTVDFHILNISRKLKVHSRMKALIRAASLGLIPSTLGGNNYDV